MHSCQLQVDCLKWEQVALTVKTVKPDLHTLISRVAKGLKRRAQVCRLSIPFGAEILREGKLAPQITLPPVNGEPAWAPLPLGLLIERSAEVFRYVPDFTSANAEPRPRTHPLAIIRSGEFFGVFEAIDRMLGRPGTTPSWNMTSGVRSIHLVGALDNQDLRNRFASALSMAPGGGALTEYSWELVRALAEADDWRAVCLFFPDHWFSEGSEASQELRVRILEEGWRQSAALRQESLRHDELATWCARQLQRLPWGDLRQKRIIIDSAMPGLLQLLETVLTSDDAISLGLWPFRASSELEDLGPIEAAAAALSQALTACRLQRGPLIAIPTKTLSRPRYVPFRLPLRRMPQPPDRGWPEFLCRFGRFLHWTLVKKPDSQFTVRSPEIDLRKVDLIASPSTSTNPTSYWSEPLGTRHGRLLPADLASLRQHCDDFGDVGDGVVSGSPFFTACIRIAGASGGNGGAR